MNIAVLFDMDGVIVDSNPYHKLAFEAFLAHHQMTLTGEQLKAHVYGRTNQEIMRYIFKADYSPEKGEAWANEKEEIFRQLYREVSPVKGIVPFLQSLKAYHIKTAVATSAPKLNLDYILDKIGIMASFDVQLHSGSITCGKPDPEIYLRAAGEAGVPPGNCIVIEDSLSGITAGLRAGMKVIGITTTHTPAELTMAHHIIKDFEELTISVLQNLLR